MKKNYFLSLAMLALISCQQPQNSSTTEVKEEKNATVETIMSRRSIRSYKPEQISDTQLDTIVQCAINAPSALNKQSWEVRVIQNPELLKKINEGFIEYSKGKELAGSASKAQDQRFSVFHGAPTLVIVAGLNNSYSPVDCGLFGQNVLLAAESMDIGTCVVGSVIAYLETPEAAPIIQQLNFSEGYKPLYTIAMGYKNEHPNAKPRDKSKVQVIK